MSASWEHKLQLWKQYKTVFVRITGSFLLLLEHYSITNHGRFQHLFFSRSFLFSLRKEIVRISKEPGSPATPLDKRRVIVLRLLGPIYSRNFTYTRLNSHEYMSRRTCEYISGPDTTNTLPASTFSPLSPSLSPSHVFFLSLWSLCILPTTFVNYENPYRGRRTGPITSDYTAISYLPGVPRRGGTEKRTRGKKKSYPDRLRGGPMAARYYTYVTGPASVQGT